MIVGRREEKVDTTTINSLFTLSCTTKLVESLRSLSKFDPLCNSLLSLLGEQKSIVTFMVNDQCNVITGIGRLLGQT